MVEAELQKVHPCHIIASNLGCHNFGWNSPNIILILEQIHQEFIELSLLGDA